MKNTDKNVGNDRNREGVRNYGYTPEELNATFDYIIERIEAGEAMTTVCDSINMCVNTFYKWINSEISEEAHLRYVRYSRAQIIRADRLFESILTISDDASNDVLPDGKANHANVQRSRLKVDARKWVTSKMNPGKYGDSIDIKSAGEKISSTPIINITYKPPIEE